MGCQLQISVVKSKVHVGTFVELSDAFYFFLCVVNSLVLLMSELFMLFGLLFFGFKLKTFRMLQKYG